MLRILPSMLRRPQGGLARLIPPMFMPHATVSTHSATHSHTTIALARDLPHSFSQALSKLDNPLIDVELARSQHQGYLERLRSMVPVLLLPADEAHPDCVFIEDTAVVVGKVAVINRIGAESRRGEVGPVKQALEALGVTTVDMRDPQVDPSGEATADGGDVMFTGRHLFVGLSTRTNQAGADVLRRAFEHLTEVVVVADVGDNLHLKSLVSHLDDRTLLLPDTATGRRCAELLDAQAKGYGLAFVPEARAANVVNVNGNVVVPAGCEASTAVWSGSLTPLFAVHAIEGGEFEKADGALTCKSILLTL